jgi:hypothetical protein
MRIPSNNIIGVLPANHFLKDMDEDGAADIRSLLLKPILHHKTMKLDDALKRLRGGHTHHGGRAGRISAAAGHRHDGRYSGAARGRQIWDETDDIVEECREKSRERVRMFRHV